MMIYACLKRRQLCERLFALDDEQLARAQEFTGLTEKSALVREALKALIEREAARRLARLGGSQLRLKAPRRRRTKRK